MPLGMRMEIAHDLRAGLSSGAMCIDQRLRIDLEMTERLGMDIARFNEPRNRHTIAQQDTAGFDRVSGLGGARECFDHVPCHFERFTHEQSVRPELVEGPSFT